MLRRVLVVRPGQDDIHKVGGGEYRNPCGAAGGHVDLEVKEVQTEGGEGRHLQAAPSRIWS